MSSRILILNGPNLNLLGVREPAIYGSGTLKDIESYCIEKAISLGLSIDFRQSNCEGDLITWAQEAFQRKIHGIIINPGAYTHTSIALYDALIGLDIPIIEVHLSNIFAREPFRHHSYVSPAASGIICGLGAIGYVLALEAIAAILVRSPRE